jgi:polysaccharide biosynthesis PFTS motif protein
VSNLKTALKGYDILNSSGNLDKINNIKLDLTNKPIRSIEGKASKIIFGKAADRAELVTRQYLLMRFADLNLNRQILESIAEPEKGITLKLPAEWRKTISSHQVNVSKFRSAYHWNHFLLSSLLTHGKLLLRTIYDCVLQILTIRKTAAKSMIEEYTYFFSLNGTNFPQPDKAGISHDFVSWYINWSGRNKDVQSIRHNVQGQESMYWKGVEISYLDNPFLPLYTRKAILDYFFWCVKAVFTSVISIFTGRWWNILILEEAIYATKMRYQETDLIAKEYCFNNSGWIYRPLWTYEAEAKGSKIHFYFYSTNCETFASTSKKVDFHYGYQSMNWPHYLVWDKYQEDFVRNAAGIQSNISVVGPIWFATSARELEKFSEKTIAVFDVQPMRDAFYKTLGISFEYYVPRVCNQFLSDILEVSKLLNYKMALKRKRDIGRKVHPTYGNFLKDIENSDNFVSIDSNISAIKVIENSSLVISMAFTSTAILGRELNKPSVFYDPLNMLQKDDGAAHGIQIISGVEDLALWVKTNIKNTTVLN